MAARGFRNQSVIPLGSANGPLSIPIVNFSFGPAENSGGAVISGMITEKFYIDLIASASVTGFAVGDITVINGTASEFTAPPEFSAGPNEKLTIGILNGPLACLLYTSPSPRD